MSASPLGPQLYRDTDMVWRAPDISKVPRNMLGLQWKMCLLLDPSSRTASSIAVFAELFEMVVTQDITSPVARNTQHAVAAEGTDGQTRGSKKKSLDQATSIWTCTKRPKMTHSPTPFFRSVAFFRADSFPASLCLFVNKIQRFRHTSSTLRDPKNRTMEKNKTT